ncbi:MAG: O-methyltransferase [Sandaracinaceae bacterium]|jgi:caffeoyl-CoA O-methyltransferase|nr:O-methyltransferase [Sandaracinaceae bacterium]
MADTQSRAGARFATAEIMAWLERVHSAHDATLEAVYLSPEKTGLPAIQLGHAEAGFLEWFVRFMRARVAVEVGTLAGYSAVRIARALAADGHLYSLEADPAHAKVARTNLKQAGLSDKVTVIDGFAATTLPSVESKGPFDLVFLDADKGGYEHYGRWARAHLRPGGVLIADNVYLFGRLLDSDDEAASVRRFHEETAQHFDTACIPTPDGLLVGVRR